MNVKNKTRRYFALTALASSLIILHSPVAYALQELNEQDMRQVNGQDGIYLSTTYDRVDIDQVYWEDKTGTAANAEEALRGYANGVSITGSNLGTVYQIQTGSNGTTAGMDLNIDATLGTIAANSFQICNGVGANCGPTIGSLAIQSSTPANIHLITTDGLFNQSATAQLALGLKNINIYLGQLQAASATTQNQLIVKNFNFNFFGKGNIYVDDTGGLRLQTGSTGYVDFSRVADPTYTAGTFGGTNSGLNLEFMHKANATIGLYDVTGAKGIIRAGASGRMVNGSLVFRGIDARNATDTVLGYASDNTTTATSGTNATIVGSTGLAMRLRGEFTRDQADADSFGTGGTPTTLELGGAGKNAYGVEFGKLTPLLTRTTASGSGPSSLNTGRAYLDSGNIYLNLADTKTMQLPANSLLNASRFGSSTLTTNADYTRQLYNGTVNPYSLILAIRGMEFQALSRRGRFIVSNDVVSTDPGYIAPTAGLTNTWGIGLPIYNLNGNVALYGTTYTGALADGTSVTGSQRIGFAASLSTQGVSTDGSKTTSIFLIDGGANAVDGNNPTDYYFGLRNIDMLLSGMGTIGFENGKLNVRLPNLNIVMAAQIAAGYLPGATYKTLLNGSPVYSPVDNFTRSTDVLFGLKLKLAGDMNFSIVPSDAGSLSATQVDANKLGFIGSFNMTSGAIQISDPVDGSILGLDNLSGNLGFNNALIVNKDNAQFNLGLKFNPNNQPNEVFRVKDVNFYPSTGAAQRLGEMVITGGNLTSNVKITPFN